MANEQSGCPLRRWRPFYGAFVAIDDAIEEAGGHSRAAFRDVRVRILKLLRAATDDDVAEQLCAAHDDAMVEALQTLRVVPVPHRALASTDLARLIGALRNHNSARIRSLAGDVLRGWRAASVATSAAVKDEAAKLSTDDGIPGQSVSASTADGNARGHEEKMHVQPAKMLAAAEVHKKKLHMTAAKEMLPAAPVAEANKNKVHLPQAKMLLTTTATILTPTAESKKMEASKRKLQEGYEEAKKIKRQRIIQKIDGKVAAKMFEQKQGKMHPNVRRRGPAACRSRISSGVRRSLLPSLQMI